MYLKTAIKKLVSAYPTLAKTRVNPESSKPSYELLVRFLEYSKRTRFLVQLFGGTSYLNYFISKFETQYAFYKAPKPQHPVLIILDNDSGFYKEIENKLKKMEMPTIYPISLKKHDFRKADFIHVMHNLYIVLTPLSAAGKDTEIEDLFDTATRGVVVSGKTFNPKDGRDNVKEYGKEVFAKKVIQDQRNKINFDGLKPLLDRMVRAIEHYDSIKNS
ncbi:MAG: hypothetical protein IKE45_08735 [Halomonas sp.]|nr:hypothetical protein [Halomonas sp.]MBR2514096.1 hypothetical protein [Halomonas sp.]